MKETIYVKAVTGPFLVHDVQTELSVAGYGYKMVEVDSSLAYLLYDAFNAFDNAQRLVKALCEGVPVVLDSSGNWTVAQ